MHLSLALVLSASYAYAFIWSKTSISQDVPSSDVLPPPSNNALIEAEISAIMDAQSMQFALRMRSWLTPFFPLESLSTLSSGSDCFRRAAGTIRVQCDEMEMNEDERVRMAIEMTMCELGTAHHLTVPLECAESRRVNVEGQSKCVECVIFLFHAVSSSFLTESFRALSRSAQFWSSYSGYLREIRAHISTSQTLPLLSADPNLQHNYVSHSDGGTT